MASASPTDVFVDIGCGDGRVMIWAAQQVPGMRCVGLEINAELVADTKAAVAAAGLQASVQVVEEVGSARLRCTQPHAALFAHSRSQLNCCVDPGSCCPSRTRWCGPGSRS